MKISILATLFLLLLCKLFVMIFMDILKNIYT